MDTRKHAQWARTWALCLHCGPRSSSVLQGESTSFREHESDTYRAVCAGVEERKGSSRCHSLITRPFARPIKYENIQPSHQVTGPTHQVFNAGTHWSVPYSQLESQAPGTWASVWICRLASFLPADPLPSLYPLPAPRAGIGYPPPNHLTLTFSLPQHCWAHF